MRRAILSFILVVLVLLLIKRPFNNPKNLYVAPTRQQNNPVVVDRKSTYGVFVPYWRTKRDNNYSLNPVSKTPISKTYYFGITFNQDGEINTDEAGYVQLANFNVSKLTNSFLVVRLIDQKVIDSLLENPQISSKIAKQSIEIAKTKRFDGITVDLEYSTLPTSKTKDQITRTISIFAEESKNNNLLVGMTVFGDTFFRGRPYDVVPLSKIVDEMIVMAYDFHKSRSLPGPLFPYEKKQYGYSYQEMIRDFIRFVPAGKLTVAYGLYGYSWRVDNRNRPIKPGVAKPYKTIIEEKNKCFPPICKVDIDSNSNELKMKTNNMNDSWSIIYSETPDSIKIKTDFAREKFVNNFIIWAYGYY